jgi:hypothetical protein
LQALDLKQVCENRFLAHTGLQASLGGSAVGARTPTKCGFRKALATLCILRKYFCEPQWVVKMHKQEEICIAKNLLIKNNLGIQ